MVLTIVREHFQNEDNKQRFLHYSKKFNLYFQNLCTRDNYVTFLSYNPTDELFQLLYFLSDHLLEGYGYSKDYKNTWSTRGREWRDYQNVDALVLPPNDIFLTPDFPSLNGKPFRYPVLFPFRRWDYSLYLADTIL